MVVAIPSPTAATPIAAAASTVRAHKSPSPHHHCPLSPSEKDNAALSRKPQAKEISSRFLTSSSSSFSTSTSRCVPSLLPTSSSSGPKRSHSVDRSHHSAVAKGSGAAPLRPPGPSAPPPRASLSPSKESPSSSRPARPSPPYLLPLPGSPPLTADVSLELRREAIAYRRTRNPLTTTSVGDEDISTDQSSDQSNQALDVPIPATQNQQTTSGKPTPGSLRRSQRLQNKRA